MTRTREYAAYAPATVANLNCGFDCLGLAVASPGDVVVAERGDRRGLHFASDEPDDGFPRVISRNTAGVAAQALLRALGAMREPVRLRLRKGMARGTGMGSSAASAAAAVVAVNALLGRPLSKRQLLPFAADGEAVADGARHADNVAPSLLGGLVLVRDSVALDVVPLPVPKSLWVTLAHPPVELLTARARAVLPRASPREAWVAQAADLAGFVAACFRGDLPLLARSMSDRIVGPARAPLIPRYEAVRRAARLAGALAVGISGSGPSMFALTASGPKARAVARAMANAFGGATTWVSRVNGAGAVLLPRGGGA